MTSKFCMQFLSKKGTGHTDATYKITSTGYCLIIYGVTDIRGHFHLVSFMISSHETYEDFHLFYQGMQTLAAQLKIEFNPRFLMQDACQASFNAARAVFPDAIVLMCYFHVKQNIRKNLSKSHILSKEVYNEFETDVTNLHYSNTEEEYNERLVMLRKKYSEYSAAMEYMEKQWLSGPFSNWQIFRNNPGYANTNSNIESFNASFKRDYTKFFKCSMYSSVNKIFECIIEYSNAAQNHFYDSPSFDKNLKKKALSINAQCFKRMGTKSSKKVLYTGESGISYVISMDDTRCYKSWSCNCSTFIKWALCRHVIAYSNSTRMDLYGSRYRQPENFVPKEKRGAKKKITQSKILNKFL